VLSLSVDLFESEDFS